MRLLQIRDNDEDYLARVELIDDQLACLVLNLDDSEQRGIVATALMLQRAASQIRGIVPGSARYRGDNEDRQAREQQLGRSGPVRK